MKILIFSTRHPCRLREKLPFQLIDAYYFYPDGVAAVTLSRHLAVPVVIAARGTNLNLIPRYPWSWWLIQWVACMITVCQAYEKGFSWDTTSQGQKALFGRTLAEQVA